MKKFAMLVLILIVIVMNITSASAVQMVGQSTTNIADYQQSSFLLTSNGALCALLNVNENNNTVSIAEVASSVSNFGYQNGKMVRFKGSHLITIGEDGRIATGASNVACTIEITSQGMPVFSHLGITNGAEAIDSTILAVDLGNGTYRAFHRILDSDKGIEVARVWFLGSEKYASLRYADWDGDGVQELCFRAGLAKKSSGGKSNGGSGHGGNGSGNSGGNGGGNGGSSKPDPQNDDIILPWS